MALLVAGIGNIFTGDDGFGPAVVAHMLASVPDDLDADVVRIVDMGVRTLHLAYDLVEQADPVLLVDTVALDRPPGTVLRLAAAETPDQGAGAHGLSVPALLARARALAGPGARLPTVEVLGCVPATFEAVGTLSEPVRDAIEPAAAAAWSWVRDHRDVAPSGSARRRGAPD